MTKTLGELLQAATDAVRSMTWEERVRGNTEDPCADLLQCPHTRVIGYCKDCEIEGLRTRVAELEDIEKEACKACMRAEEERDELRAQRDDLANDLLVIVARELRGNWSETASRVLALMRERIGK